MAENQTRASTRRAFLAATAAGSLLLAGCSQNRDGTSTPTGTDRPSDAPLDGTDTSADPGEETTGTDAPTATETESPTEDQTATDGGTPAADLEPGEGVLVDQVGYLPDEDKRAIVRTDATTFEVRTADSDERVASGDLSKPIEAESAGETVRHAEFGDLTQPGAYVLRTSDGAESHPFEVGKGVWGQVLAEVGRHYTLQRAGTAIDDPITGLQFAAGHRQDREARMYFEDEFHEEGERVDVRGGWYDAGDYGKYVPPAAVTVSQFLLAYEWNPETFEVGQFAMPNDLSQAEREAGMPDLLAEVKFELEWLERMQRPDGAVYHKVSGSQWPGFVPPAEDTQTRYVYGLSTYGTAMYAGTMAMAARVYEPFDAGFADRMLDNAESAFGYLEDNPDPYFRRDEGQNDGSGGYRKDGDAAERFWAGAELLKTTDDPAYAEYLESTLPGEFGAGPDSISWANGRLLGQWAYYTADAGSEQRRDEVANTIQRGASDLANHVANEGYYISLSPDEYYWASNKVAVAKGTILLMADRIEPNERYRQAAREQVHYVLGRSPTTYAYVTGAGENPPTDTHDRIDQSTGVSVPGHLVGGPNDNGDDDTMRAYIQENDPAPAKAYVDEMPAYSVNEPAIDYAAPLVVALAEFTPAGAISPE